MISSMLWVVEVEGVAREDFLGGPAEWKNGEHFLIEKCSPYPIQSISHPSPEVGSSDCGTYLSSNYPSKWREDQRKH
jgi:hypothetical protein